MPKKFFATTTSEKGRCRQLAGKSSHVELEAVKVKTEYDVCSLDSSRDMDFQNEFNDFFQESTSNMAKTLLAEQKNVVEVKTGGIVERFPRWGEPSHNIGRGKPSDDTKMQCDKEKAMENVILDTVDTSFEMDYQSLVDNILKEFSDDVMKFLVSKQKKLGMYIQETADKSVKNMDHVFKVHQTEQQLYFKEYRENLVKFFEDSHANVNADKENLAQLEEQIKQQEKQLNELLMPSTLDLEAFQQTSDTYFENCDELNQDYEDRFNDVQNNVAKKINLTEKKVLTENQAMSMSKLRKNLQSFFE